MTPIERILSQTMKQASDGTAMGGKRPGSRFKGDELMSGVRVASLCRVKKDSTENTTTANNKDILLPYANAKVKTKQMR